MRAGPPGASEQPSATRSSPSRARGLDQHDVAGPRARAQQRDRRVGVGRRRMDSSPHEPSWPGAEVHGTGALADDDQSVDVQPHGEPPDRVVLGVGVVAELEHLPEHGPACAGPPPSRPSVFRAARIDSGLAL